MCLIWFTLLIWFSAGKTELEREAIIYPNDYPTKTHTKACKHTPLAPRRRTRISLRSGLRTRELSDGYGSPLPENDSSTLPENDSSTLPENDSSTLPENDSSTMPENDSSPLPENDSSLPTPEILTTDGDQQITATLNANKQPTTVEQYFDGVQDSSLRKSAQLCGSNTIFLPKEHVKHLKANSLCVHNCW